MNKQRTTVWPDGRVQSTQWPVPLDVETDMADTRASHSMLPSTVSCEEIHHTLVVTKETGTVHVYNWTE